MKAANPSSVGSQLTTLSTTCGVKPTPSITPMIIVIGGRTVPGAAIGARTRAARVQAVMEPSIHGSGRSNVEKTKPPAPPTTRAARNRP